MRKISMADLCIATKNLGNLGNFSAHLESLRVEKVAGTEGGGSIRLAKTPQNTQSAVRACSHENDAQWESMTRGNHGRKNDGTRSGQDTTTSGSSTDDEVEVRGVRLERARRSNSSPEVKERRAEYLFYFFSPTAAYCSQKDKR